jgi:hypothetical protein
MKEWSNIGDEMEFLKTIISIFHYSNIPIGLARWFLGIADGTKL